MNVRQFIAEVKKRRLLWDQAVRSTPQDKRNMNDAWIEIAKMFNEEVNTVKQKWKNLRDTFRVELKKAKYEFNGIDDPTARNWAYYEDLYFLKDILKVRSYCEHSCDTIEMPSTDPNEYLTENVKTEEDSDVTVSPSRIAIADEQSGNPLFENVTSLFEDESTFKAKRRRLEDESTDDDLLFFRSLMPFVKKLDQDKKLLFRMNVQQMLYEQLYSNN